MSESSVHCGVSICVGLVCRRDDLFVKKLTKLLIPGDMLWYLIILINTNNPPPKFGTEEFLCAVLRFFSCHLIL